MTEISPYLHGFAMRAARHFQDGTQASITLRHHGAVVRAASSDDRSARCDQVEALAEDGPCVAAMRGGDVVLVPQVGSERRWPGWRAQATTEGFVSAVAVPAHVAPGMDVALNLYAVVADPWGPGAVADADRYARRIASAVGLRVQLSALDPQVELELSGDEVIAQAVGATMHCNGCTAEEALEILAGAAAHRSVGLEEVAATVLRALTGIETRAPGTRPTARDAVGRPGADHRR